MTKSIIPPGSVAGHRIGDAIICRCNYAAYPKRIRLGIAKIIPRWYYICSKCWTFGPRRITKARAARAFIKKIGG